MASSEAVERLINSLAFQVEAVPQDDVLEISGTSKATPLNLKIRVRKKEEALFKQGVVSVPKLGHPKKPPEKIRLVSSDQTVLSFKVFVDTDPGKKPIKKRKSFFGGCLSSEDNDDDAYVHSHLATATKSGDVVKLNFGLSKTENIQDIPLQPRKPIMFFGNKCKPGGCLDPPFGEEKYSYEPKSESHKASVQDYLETKKQKQDILTDTIPKEGTHKGNLKESFGKISSGDETARDEIKTNTTSIQSILPPTKADSVKSSVDTKFSDSIITYPPNEPAEEITRKQSSPKRVSDESSRKSFQEFRDSYYSPPKSVTNSRNNSDAVKGEQKENATNFEDQRTSNNKGKITKLYPEENIKHDLKPFGDDTERIFTPDKEDHKTQSVTGTLKDDLQFEKDGEKGQLTTKKEAPQDTLNSGNDENLQSEKERNVINDILIGTGVVTAPLLIAEVAKQIANKDNRVQNENENANNNDEDTKSKISSSIHLDQDGVLNSPSSKPDETTESLESSKGKKESLNKTDISINEKNYTEQQNETSSKAKGDSLSEIKTNHDTQGHEEGKDIDLFKDVQSPDKSLGELITNENYSKSDDNKDKKCINDSIHTGKEDILNPQENKMSDDLPNMNIDDNSREIDYKESQQKESNVDHMNNSENKEFQQKQPEDSSYFKENQNLNQDQRANSKTSDKSSINNERIQSDFENSNKAKQSSSVGEPEESSRDAAKTNQQKQDKNMYQDTRDNKNKIYQQETSTCDGNNSEISQKRDKDKNKNQTIESTHQPSIIPEQFLDGNIKGEKTKPSVENIYGSETIKQTGTNKQHKSITKPSTNFPKSQISQHCDFVNIDLAFHSYKNDQNESVIKSLDDTKDFKRRSQDNVTIIKSILQLNTPSVIKVPIDNHKYLILEIKCSDHQKPSSSPTTEADVQGFVNDEHLGEGPSEQPQAELETFQNLLATVYEHQLLPLQSLISDLKKDVEMLATQQLWLKDNWNRTKKTKTVRSTHSSRKCVCYRK